MFILDNTMMSLETGGNLPYHDAEYSLHYIGHSGAGSELLTAFVYNFKIWNRTL